jgi:hypothetical protein
LEEQAKKAAVAVLNGDSEHYALPAMTPYERRIVHQYLQEHFTDLASESEGLGPDRHIVISFRGMPADAAGAQGYETEDGTDNGDDEEGQAAALTEKETS